MGKIRIILLISLILSVAIGFLLHSEKTVDESIYLKEIAPDQIFSSKKNNLLYYLSDKGTVAFNTYDLVPNIRGYAGPIKLLLALDPEGKITGLKILEHSETKNYVRFMETPQYLSQFIGKGIGDRFEVDSDVDGISRATVSVGALAKTIKDSSRAIASDAYHIDVKDDGSEITQNIKWLWYLVLFSLSSGLYFATRKSKRLLAARDASLAAGIIVIGGYLSSPFSVLHIFNIILLRPSFDILWLIIIISTFLSIIIAGRFYCGWLCPFGALSEFIGRLPFKKWDITAETDERFRKTKYVLLILTMAAVLVCRKVDFGNFEVYVTLFSFQGNLLSWSLVALTLSANLSIERFWCRYLCPVAAVTGALSRRDNGYISRQDCPMANRQDPHISECIRCNRCYSKKGDI